MLDKAENSTAIGPVDAGPKSVGRGVALVTGGRRGIGRAICTTLAMRGFDIALVDIVEDQEVEKTVSAVEATGKSAIFQQLDISETDKHDEIVENVQFQLGEITCLVNNAGIQVPVRGDILDVSEETFDQLMDINLKGTFFLTQAVARKMVSTKSGYKERSIITITSANAALVSPEKGPYCISKAGLSMASQQFAIRLAADGIRVHEIRPGLIETDMTADVFEKYSPDVATGSICPMRRWGQPEDIATGIATLAIGAMPFSTGDIYNIGGGMQIPRL
ncbi:3-ketoacyl-ACP reductase [uncultured Sulfitobacter sp.]|jgi:NAD(P)-dependent dehydrogenase (short-subunit alcohol dehydrogenase family)|uniref:3-ketoacyl-ACP reductase n=1 Tax=uncultured Sulfitobacter sp. TaxID=191468 RepID=UPI0030FC34D2